MTKPGRKIQAYLDAHPDEDSPSVIAKATGTNRDTVRSYLRRRAAAAAPPDAPAPAPTPATAAAAGEDLHKDYPGRTGPPPAPKPDDQVDDHVDDQAREKPKRFRLVL